MYYNDVCCYALQALGVAIRRIGLAVFNYTPNPRSGWACLVQLLDFWQMSIMIYICLVMAYMRVRASFLQLLWIPSHVYVLTFKLVVHAFSIVCMLAAMLASTRHMMQMLWHLMGLW